MSRYGRTPLTGCLRSLVWILSQLPLNQRSSREETLTNYTRDALKMSCSNKLLKLREGCESPSFCGDDTGQPSPATQVRDANNHFDGVQDSAALTHDLITSQTKHQSVEQAACTLSICHKNFHFCGPVEVALEALAQCTDGTLAESICHDLRPATMRSSVAQDSSEWIQVPKRKHGSGTQGTVSCATPPDANGLTHNVFASLALDNDVSAEEREVTKRVKLTELNVVTDELMDEEKFVRVTKPYDLVSKPDMKALPKLQNLNEHKAMVLELQGATEKMVDAKGFAKAVGNFDEAQHYDTRNVEIQAERDATKTKAQPPQPQEQPPPQLPQPQPPQQPPQQQQQPQPQQQQKKVTLGSKCVVISRCTRAGGDKPKKSNKRRKRCSRTPFAQLLKRLLPFCCCNALYATIFFVCIQVPVLHVRGQVVECDAYEPFVGSGNNLGQDWHGNTQLAIDNAMESANIQGLDDESHYAVPCLDTSNDC